jgi:K+-transporting ATPase KdpF subunit
MSWLDVCALVLAVLAAIYLVVVLFDPERYS